MTTNGQEPAFPCLLHNAECNHPTGLTKREYMAIEAMKPLIDKFGMDMPESAIAQNALKYAHAMLAALDESK